MGKYVAPTHHYGEITAMVKRDSVECDGGLAEKRKKIMIKMIRDFIKSWFYYPAMVKYLKSKYNVEYPYSRFRYSWWHCHAIWIWNK